MIFVIEKGIKMEYFKVSPSSFVLRAEHWCFLIVSMCFSSSKTGVSLFFPGQVSSCSSVLSLPLLVPVTVYLSCCFTELTYLMKKTAENYPLRVLLLLL